MKSKLQLEFGSAADRRTIEIPTDNITIFVGPNNSGKSLVLREIENLVRTEPQTQQQPRHIVKDLEFDKSNSDILMDLLNKYKIGISNGITASTIFNSNMGSRNFTFVQENLVNQISENPRIALNVMNHFTIRLDATTRFGLVQSAYATDLQLPPQNMLTALFKDSNARVEISKFVHDAFGYYFVIDPTGMQQLRIRLSKTKPEDLEQEQGLSTRSQEFHKQAVLIDDFSDGVKSILGLLIPLYCGDYKTILIDEPEAFLHPPLARRLGKKLAQLSAQRDANIFISTHSPEFVMGCIEAGVNVNIVRLSYHENISSIKTLTSQEIVPLMRDPLLRSSDTLSALFHKSAIVTESDSDRVFYQEINQRMIENDKPGADDCAFLNAQNWQTISHIIGPLRQIGVKSAAIVDVDVIMSSGVDWKKLLKACGLPNAMVDTLGVLRGQVETFLLNAVPDHIEHNKRREHIKKKGGISILTGQARQSAQALIDNLANYGLFVVPQGEMESWLPELELVGHGPTWVIPIFEKMGSDPSSENYLRPPTIVRDVWAFLERIGHYLNSNNN